LLVEEEETKLALVTVETDTMVAIEDWITVTHCF